MFYYWAITGGQHGRAQSNLINCFSFEYKAIRCPQGLHTVAQYRGFPEHSQPNTHTHLGFTKTSRVNTNPTPKRLFYINRFSKLRTLLDVHKRRLWNLKTLEGSGTEGAYVPWGLAGRNTLILPTTTTGNDLTPLAWAQGAPYPFWWHEGKGKREEKVTGRQARKNGSKKEWKKEGTKERIRSYWWRNSHSFTQFDFILES